MKPNISTAFSCNMNLKQVLVWPVEKDMLKNRVKYFKKLWSLLYYVWVSPVDFKFQQNGTYHVNNILFQYEPIIVISLTSKERYAQKWIKIS